MTKAQIRKAAQTVLDKYKLTNKFTVRTVGFSDLARGDAIFVTIKGWRPSKLAIDVKRDIEGICGKGVIVDFE